MSKLSLTKTMALGAALAASIFATAPGASAFGLRGFGGRAGGFSRTLPNGGFKFGGFNRAHLAGDRVHIYCLPGYVYNAYLRDCQRARPDRPHPPRLGS